MKNKKLEIGKIINTHGIRGEVKVMPLTDDARRYDRLEWVYIDKVAPDTKLFIEKLRYHKNNVIIKFKKVNTMNEAEKLKNKSLFINRELAVELPEDTYFICDLIGSEVLTVEGQNLGKICDIISTGSNDVYIIKNDSNKEILIPAIKDVVKKVDIENSLIIVKLLEGLIDNDE